MTLAALAKSREEQILGLRAVRFPRECGPVRRPLQADEQTAREKGTFAYPSWGFLLSDCRMS